MILLGTCGEWEKKVITFKSLTASGSNSVAIDFPSTCHAMALSIVLVLCASSYSQKAIMNRKNHDIYPQSWRMEVFSGPHKDRY